MCQLNVFFHVILVYHLFLQAQVVTTLENFAEEPGETDDVAYITVDHSTLSNTSDQEVGDLPASTSTPTEADLQQTNATLRTRKTKMDTINYIINEILKNSTNIDSVAKLNLLNSSVIDSVVSGNFSDDRQPRTLKTIAFLAGLKFGKHFLQGAHAGLGFQSTGSFAASNSLTFLGKVFNAALSVSYGTPLESDDAHAEATDVTHPSESSEQPQIGGAEVVEGCKPPNSFPHIVNLASPVLPVASSPTLVPGEADEMNPSVKEDLSKKFLTEKNLEELRLEFSNVTRMENMNKLQEPFNELELVSEQPQNVEPISYSQILPFGSVSTNRSSIKLEENFNKNHGPFPTITRKHTVVKSSKTKNSVIRNGNVKTKEKMFHKNRERFLIEHNERVRKLFANTQRNQAIPLVSVDMF